jgi:hypothetical protein
MKVIRFVCASMLGLAVLLAVGTAAPVLAVQPIIQVIQLNRTVVAPRPTQTCGFTVMRHDEGTIRFITRYDENGNPIMEIDVYHLNQTLTANGHSLSGRTIGIDNITYNADGSITMLSAGPDLWTIAPNGGPVWGATGSIATEIDASGNEAVVRESGPNHYFDPAICPYLAP